MTHGPATGLQADTHAVTNTNAVYPGNACQLHVVDGAGSISDPDRNVPDADHSPGLRLVRPRHHVHQHQPGRATGTLQLFLENPDYIGPPGNYGMAKIGWPGPASASIENNFTGSATYHPTWDYPFGYDALTAGTIVSFEIVGCGTNGTCHGTVTIDFERIAAP